MALVIEFVDVGDRKIGTEDDLSVKMEFSAEMADTIFSVSKEGDYTSVKKVAEEFLKTVTRWNDPIRFYCINIEGHDYVGHGLQGVVQRDGSVRWTDWNIVMEENGMMIDKEC